MHTWVINSSNCEPREKHQNPQKSRYYLESIPRLDKDWSSPNHKHSSLQGHCFSFSIWRSRSICGVLGEDRVRGKSAGELWVLVVPQGRRLGAQSSDLSEWTCFIFPAGLWGDHTWFLLGLNPPTSVDYLLEVGNCSHIWCGSRFFPLPSLLLSSFLSFNMHSWSADNVPGSRDTAVNITGSPCHQGACNLVGETDNEKPNK